MAQYSFKEVEKAMLAFWKEENLHQKANALAEKTGKGKKPFYFLDGPPYTSGKAHVGTAWGKTLKDMTLRYKRMTGNKVWDRAGYDMHGLPTENAVMKELGLKTKEDILEYGLDKFIDKCRKLCVRNLKAMNEDFHQIGVWMDFENAYQSITKDFMSGEWWLIKQAHEKGRLYEGLRTMTWSAAGETAVAKHELEYKTIKDTSIYVKFKIKDSQNEYLVIWTTTPWTIPMNMAVMVNPDVDYVKVQVGKEVWVLAKDLRETVLQKAEEKGKILEEMKGKQLEGVAYEHVFAQELKEAHKDITAKKFCTVLLSKEYVDTSAGTGLVHCAPGCGPEDYEVGHANGIPPFNPIDTKGVFPEITGMFAGFVAKKDDKKFVKAIEEAGALVAKEMYEHDYAHDERYHEPVIFRTTKQWFFKIEDMKDKLVKENNNIKWVPQAAYNAFDSWLKNLRDNSVSKQRFWGCPIPIWRNVEDEEDYIVIGSAEELEQLCGQTVDDLHMNTVDKIVIEKEGKTYKRIPDVLDVWVDAGTTSWNCLNNDPKLMQEYFPADFILEGKDQIRGWFNLLHIASMIGLGKPSFKACYMHGFVNDAQGRKMSKSLGNYILPGEVTEKYGADTMRYYMIGAANPGLDMNYNFEDMDVKHRNLHVFWNIHNFLLDMQKTNNLVLREPKKSEMTFAEEYMNSLYNSCVQKVTKAFDEYRLNEIPLLLEECLLELSRTYMQLTREKVSIGSQEEKEVVFSTIFTTFKGLLTMFATITPFITERMYQDMRANKVFGLEKESVHLEEWPQTNTKAINEQIESDMRITQAVITGILAAREKAGLGVRWPLAKVRVETQRKEVESAVTNLMQLIQGQTNVKEIVLEKAPVKIMVKPNFKNIGKEFGQETAKVVTAITKEADAIGAALGLGEEKMTVDGFEITKDMLQVAYESQEGSQVAQFTGGILAADTALTPELEAEGYTRELIRRVQDMRKNNGFEKSQRIVLAISGEKELLSRISAFDEYLQEKVGASKLLFTEKLPELPLTQEVKIKGATFTIGFEKEQ